MWKFLLCILKRKKVSVAKGKLKVAPSSEGKIPQKFVNFAFIRFYFFPPILRCIREVERLSTFWATFRAFVKTLKTLLSSTMKMKKREKSWKKENRNRFNCCEMKWKTSKRNECSWGNELRISCRRGCRKFWIVPSFKKRKTWKICVESFNMKLLMRSDRKEPSNSWKFMKRKYRVSFSFEDFCS